MPELVVDASVALAWALPDEASAYADSVLVAAETEGLRVPELWPREIANGLAIAHIRNRLTADDERIFLGVLTRLSIQIDLSFDPTSTIRTGVAAARRYGLTAYDAAYVDLAARDGLALATLDERMRAAAIRAGVRVLDA